MQETSTTEIPGKLLKDSSLSSLNSQVERGHKEGLNSITFFQKKKKDTLNERIMKTLRNTSLVFIRLLFSFWALFILMNISSSRLWLLVDSEQIPLIRATYLEQIIYKHFLTHKCLHWWNKQLRHFRCSVMSCESSKEILKQFRLSRIHLLITMHCSSLENYAFDSWTKFSSSEPGQVTELKLTVCLWWQVTPKL